jgi:hypothetical protein
MALITTIEKIQTMISLLVKIQHIENKLSMNASYYRLIVYAAVIGALA